MKAFVVDKYKKNGALRLAKVPEPEVRDDDVMVRVHATGVNLLDSKVRDGEFKLILPYRPPFVLGHDVAGIVTRVGPKVRRFKAGDEVYARPRDHRVGTFAEFIAINEADVALKPKNISMEEAASIPLVGLTAWQALVEVAKLKPGQKVFIQAGSGGVGTFAIQLAKHLGATVATTTSTKNVELVKASAATKRIRGSNMTQSNRDTQTSVQDVALIVGGGPGISSSCARLFAESGMRVGVAARNPEKAVLETLEKTHGVRRYACDASEPAAVAQLFENVVRRHRDAEACRA